MKFGQMPFTIFYRVGGMEKLLNNEQKCHNCTGELFSAANKNEGTAANFVVVMETFYRCFCVGFFVVVSLCFMLKTELKQQPRQHQ